MTSFGNREASKEDPPQNGIPGLKHWRYDLIAGLQVALVGLPLSLGIALASGAPPITGAISAIIAGFIFPFLGGAYITISGPAAGLAPALLAGMLTLGHGDIEAGYPLLLVAISLAGLVQVLLSAYKAGRFSMYFPISVVEGMLAAIGMLIIIKQLPSLLGSFNPPIESIPKAILLLPDQVMGMNPQVFAVGAGTLILLFLLDSEKLRDLRGARIIPPPLLVVLLGSVAGWWLNFREQFLVHVPHDILHQGFRFPDFAAVIQHSELWIALLTTVVTLTLINGTESLATIAAVDKIDPFRRRSDPNVTLRSMGISNILSSLAGGLTIIPGGIKSRTNMLAGGRTLWANFYYAVFMSLLLWFGTSVINHIPLTVLAALLIWIGWKLCAPKVYLRILSVGKEQTLIATVCVVATLFTSDLLLGVILGTLTKVLVLTVDVIRATGPEQTRVGLLARIGAAFKELFSNPVIRIGDGRVERGAMQLMTVANRSVPGTGNSATPPYKIYLHSVTCMNLLKLDTALNRLAPLPTGKENFIIVLAGRVVDHTSMEYLHQFREQCERAGHHCAIVGTHNFQSFSNHVLAYRVSQQRDVMAYA